MSDRGGMGLSETSGPCGPNPEKPPRAVEERELSQPTSYGVGSEAPLSRSVASDSGRYDLDAEGYDPEWACTHCNGEGLCWDGADPLGNCPDEPHNCHACDGSGKREDQRVF